MKFLTFLALFVLSFNPALGKHDSSKTVEEAFSEGCTRYSGGGIFLLGDFSLAYSAYNCAVKAIDTGLKPLCEQERNLEADLRYYEEERDREAVAEIEEQLLEIKDSQYEIADYIYTISDMFFNWAEDLEDRIDTNDNAGFVENVLEKVVEPMLIIAEVRGMGKNLESKARRICIDSQIDFGRIRYRQ